MSTVINSANFISSHWLAWKAVGATFTEVNWLGLYGLYACIHHLAVTVGFPLHLGVKLFRNDTVTDDIMNLTIFLETFSSSLKIIIFAFKLRKVRHMEKLLKLLDARVQGWAQHNIYDELRKRLKKLIYAYIGVCAVVIMFSEISFLFQSERKLQHPAWFPFDYTNSTYKYYIAHVYQTYGGAMQLVQNYANACFPAVMLCIISAHIQMLYKRIEDIGMANESAQDSEADLEACITDHKHLLE
ncbi:odorant receptor 59a [Drosophila busckii]|nr:odorant receptor 59a [Drosophila busckii]